MPSQPTDKPSFVAATRQTLKGLFTQIEAMKQLEAVGVKLNLLPAAGDSTFGATGPWVDGDFAGTYISAAQFMAAWQGMAAIDGTLAADSNQVLDDLMRVKAV